MSRISRDSGFFSPYGMILLMKWLGLIPPWTHIYLKLLYSSFTLIYLTVLFYWRFSFNYNTVYDFLHDHLSRFMDLINFVVLICANFVVIMELLWRNYSAEIDQQIESMYHNLYTQLGRQVNCQRIRHYCMAIYVSLLMRSSLLLIMTIYCLLVTTTSELLIYSFYSELVLMLRFSHFTLYTVMILAFYQELTKVSSCLINELHRPRFEECLARSLILDKLRALQEIHGLLWQMIRNIERNFFLSLTTIMLKYAVDITVLPYWTYLNVADPAYLHTKLYCVAEEFCKVMEILVPCLICTRCDLLQRKFRALFHRISKDRQNSLLNSRILNINVQLGQETCRFSVGGFIIMNNEMLGKFLFGVISYVIIWIQIRITYVSSSSMKNGSALGNISLINR